MHITQMSRPIRPWRRRLLLVSLAFVLVVVVLLAFPDPFLSVRSEPVSCDAIVLLGGATGERDPVAADLYQRGFSQAIFVTGQGDCLDNVLLLHQRGVPTNAITVECDSRSTQENAQFTVRLLRERGFTNVTIVTSWYHSRRALSCFRHYAPEIEFQCVVSDRRQALRHQLRFVASEYVKIVAYAVRFGIWPTGGESRKTR